MLMTDEHTLIGDAKGQLELIEPDTAQIIWQMNTDNDKICYIAYCPELSSVITTGLRYKTARVWNVATGECVHVLSGHTSYLLSVAVHGTTYA